MARSIVSVSPDRPRGDRVREAAEVLDHGGLVAVPTETFYGIAADSGRPEALSRLRAVKGMLPEAPILLLLADLEQVDGVAAATPRGFRILAERFWPGPLTLVVPASANLDPSITAGTGTVGVRVPGIALPRLLASVLGRPITGTSANRHGEPPARTAAEVVRGLGEAVEVLLDGGPAPGGSPSTVLDLAGPRPRIVREGAIPIAALRSFLPDIEPAAV